MPWPPARSITTWIPLLRSSPRPVLLPTCAPEPNPPRACAPGAPPIYEMWRSCMSPGLREAKATAASLLLLAAAAARSSPEVPDAVGEGSDQAAAGAGFSAVVLNEMRRWLGSFQMCVPCTCCGDPRGVCVLSPCCYAITCNIPNRPFRFCSFPPRSCDCIHCNV